MPTRWKVREEAQTAREHERSKIIMKKVNAMTEKQVEEFYDACPSGYGVEETRVFDMLSLQYVTVSMQYIKLF